MRTIKIQGTFSGSTNNYVQVDIYRPNPDSYDFSKEYKQTFETILNDLSPGRDYFFDLAGYTAGQFNIDVTGDVVTEIHKIYKNDFKPGLVITTKP